MKEALCNASERSRESQRILGEGGYQKIVLCGLGEGCAVGIFALICGWSNLNLFQRYLLCLWISKLQHFLEE